MITGNADNGDFHCQDTLKLKMKMGSNLLHIKINTGEKVISQLTLF